MPIRVPRILFKPRITFRPMTFRQRILYLATLISMFLTETLVFM